MTRLSDAEIEELRKMESAATPGLWTLGDDDCVASRNALGRLLQEREEARMVAHVLHDLANQVCEPNWIVLCDEHEEHQRPGVAIMSAECRIVRVYPNRGDEVWERTRERAAALAALLNLVSAEPG